MCVCVIASLLGRVSLCKGSKYIEYKDIHKIYSFFMPAAIAIAHGLPDLNH